MKFLLIGINAKYIHSNPAIYSLKSYTEKHVPEATVLLGEYTINEPVSQIMQSVYRQIVGLEIGFIGISCYIWNRREVKELTSLISKVLPGIPIFLGGPEVGYEIPKQMKDFPDIAGILFGEGEKSFASLVKAFCGKHPDLSGIKGLAYRRDYNLSCRNTDGKEFMEDSDNEIMINPPEEALSMDELVFPYKDLKDFEHRIIYYETSRGCPFSCSYCLSSVDKHLRFRSFEFVSKELQFFLDAGVKQVKFVDRTFNCRHEHAMAILQYIKEHDNGVTNFHFEVAGDILTEEEMDLLSSLRPGLVQLEIGVQSTHEDTLKAICRRTDLSALRKNVARLLENENIHLHLDLIAGLPYEDKGTFENSFNEVYGMGGHELQLGFLKMLRGTSIRERAKGGRMLFMEEPPYEILSTQWLSYDDILELKEVEEMLEIYHNSGMFSYTEQYLLPLFSSAYSFYRTLAEEYKRGAYPVICSARVRRYEILLGYVQRELPEHTEVVRELLTLDYYLRENAKARPEFARERDLSLCMEWYRKEEENREFLPKYKDMDAKQMFRQTHMEILYHAKLAEDKPMPQRIVMDYRDRCPVTGQAKMMVWSLE